MQPFHTLYHRKKVDVQTVPNAITSKRNRDECDFFLCMKKVYTALTMIRMRYKFQQPSEKNRIFTWWNDDDLKISKYCTDYTEMNRI